MLIKFSGTALRQFFWDYSAEKNHRMAWVGSDPKGHPVPTGWCHGQGDLPSDQVAQNSIQPGFEHFHGWGSHNSSRQQGL